MVELFNEVREATVAEVAGLYHELDAESQAMFHKAAGVYETHPCAAFFAGVIVALLLVWWL